jgi:hypothetical protein
MRLNLKFPPTPAFMARHADEAVQGAFRVDHKTLDFTVGSLTWIDETLGAFHNDGTHSDQIAETLFSFGAYVGEVMVRNNPGGRWVDPPDDVAPLAGGWPLVQLQNGQLVNPIGKAFKRVDLGDGENVPYFYSVFTKSPPSGS